MAALVRRAVTSPSTSVYRSTRLILGQSSLGRTGVLAHDILRQASCSTCTRSLPQARCGSASGLPDRASSDLTRASHLDAWQQSGCRSFRTSALRSAESNGLESRSSASNVKTKDVTDQQQPSTGGSLGAAATILPKTLRSATAKHEQIYNIPNFLTFSRLLAAPAIGYLVLNSHLSSALILFTYAAFTDLVDGYLARRYNLQTVVGSVIDPMADKTLMTVLTVTLAAQGLIPTYLATLILGRDIALAGAAIYYRYASLPPPKTLGRYWDFSLPSAEVRPTTVSKYNTALQLGLIGAALALPVVGGQVWFATGLEGLGVTLDGVRTGMVGFEWLVAGTTVWSGLSYAVLKDAVRILGDDEALKARQGRRGRRIIGVVFGLVVLAAGWLAVVRGETGMEEKTGDGAVTIDRKKQ